MSNIIAICQLNFALLLKDKLSFFWSLGLPSIMLIFNSENITSVNDLVYWWIYIVFTAFIYGVGLFALQERDTGVLSIIFSIKWIPMQFFFGLLVTQVLYASVCLTIFNLIPTLLFELDYLHLLRLSLVSIILVIPVAFIGYNITYFRRLYASTVTSICNIVIFLCFILAGFDTPLNYINPFIILGKVMNGLLMGYAPFGYLWISSLLIIASLPSIVYFKPLSRESR